jgi:hypothetical protein
MALLADLLSEGDRARLAALGTPPTTAELAAAARESAADSTGTGKLAWLLAAHALDQSESTAQAQEHLGAVIDTELRAVASACLGALTTSDTTEETPGDQPHSG